MQDELQNLTNLNTFLIMSSYNERTINKDYIGIIKKNEDNTFSYDEISIEQDYSFIKKMNELYKSKEYSIIDMQNAFEERFPRNNFINAVYSYLCPKDYDCAYVDNVKYPEFITLEQLNNIIETKRFDLKKKYFGTYLEPNSLIEVIAEDSYFPIKERDEINAKIEAELEYTYSFYKNLFEYNRFAYAERYYNKLLEIQKDPSIVMFSTDQIGWKEPTFQFLPDLTISVRSNFAYGRSSYFHCNVKYKDVSILAYTDIVEYYYVNMNDFIRCTRSYTPSRENWNEVFGFVKYVTNMVSLTPDEFIEKWIVNELDKMMKGLRGIAKDPKGYHERYVYHGRNIEKYNTVRDIEESDKIEYAIFPDEKVLALKVEKITCCLLFLDNLKKFSSIEQRIDDYIKEIEDMNRNIVEPIKETTDSIIQELLKNNNDLKGLKIDLQLVQNELKKDNEEINNILNQLNFQSILAGKNEKYGFKSAEAIYIKQNQGKPDFTYPEKKQKEKQLLAKIEELTRIIKLRENFIKQLEKCLNRINKYLKVA